MFDGPLREDTVKDSLHKFQLDPHQISFDDATHPEYYSLLHNVGDLMWLWELRLKFKIFILNC